MLVLGKLIEWLLGKALIPALLFGLAALTGWFFKQGRAIEAAREAGKQQCEQQWQVALERQRAAAAEALLQAAHKQVAATDILNAELKHDVARITKELEVYRAGIADADQRCISERVRDLARGVEGAERGDESGVPRGSPARKRPAAARPAK